MLKVTNMSNILAKSNKLHSLKQNYLTFRIKHLVMKYLKLLALVVLFFGCKNEKNKFEVDNVYIAEIDSFFKSKMKERQGDYLQLIALHKLDSGNNSLGKNAINNLTLDIKGLPETIGNILMKDNSISFIADKNAIITTNKDSIITNTTLVLNEYGSSQKLYCDRLNWQIITRSDQQYLRVWDTMNPKIKSFKGFERFLLNSNYILEGNFTYYEQEKSEVVKAKVDGQRKVSFIGKVTFEFQGKSFSLEVGSNGFTMVGDSTNGDSTYGGGRYFYLDLPKENGLVKIDFNKLYNPPCAFSEFTTCLYPPRQNQLPFAINAGEKIILKQ